MVSAVTWVTKGWLRVAHRAQDPAQSQPWQPSTVTAKRSRLPRRDRRSRLELPAFRYFFRKGTTLRLDIAGSGSIRRIRSSGGFPLAISGARPPRCCTSATTTPRPPAGSAHPTRTMRF